MDFEFASSVLQSIGVEPLLPDSQVSGSDQRYKCIVPCVERSLAVSPGLQGLKYTRNNVLCKQLYSCLNILNFHFISFELKMCSHLNLTVAGSSSGLELLQWLLGLISSTFVYALNISCVIMYFISGNVHLKKLQISVWGTNVLRVFTFSCFTWLYLSINKYFKH